jgi:hypothetical protein
MQGVEKVSWSGFAMTTFEFVREFSRRAAWRAVRELNARGVSLMRRGSTPGVRFAA